LEIDYHSDKGKDSKRDIEVLPISTKEQREDFLTKPLASPKFKNFISKLNLINIFYGSIYERVLKLKDEDQM
jgi:hypothetical protein